MKHSKVSGKVTSKKLREVVIVCPGCGDVVDYFESNVNDKSWLCSSCGCIINPEDKPEYGITTTNLKMIVSVSYRRCGKMIHGKINAESRKIINKRAIMNKISDQKDAIDGIMEEV